MYKPPSRSLRKPNLSDDEKNPPTTSPKTEEVPNAVNESDKSQSDGKPSVKTVAKLEPTEIKLGANKTEDEPKPLKKSAVAEPVTKAQQKPVEIKAEPVKKVEEKPKKVDEKSVVSKPDPIKKVDEKPVEVKVNGIDKKDPEPVKIAESPSKKVTFKANTYKKSILQRFKPGDVLQIGTEVENENASKLFGMVLDDADFEYLCNEMPNEIQKIDSYKKGQVVIVKNDQIPTRAIITDITADKVCFVAYQKFVPFKRAIITDITEYKVCFVANQKFVSIFHLFIKFLYS